MNEKLSPLKRITGPRGELMDVHDLPKPTCHRWTPYRKAQIVVAVEGELITFDEAATRWNISAEEYGAWKRDYKRSRIDGMRVNQVQINRRDAK